MPSIPRASYSDNFTRSNGVLGSNWTYGNGSSEPAISSNTVQQTGSTDGYYPAVWHLPVLTDRFQVGITLASAPSGQASGIIIRANSTMTQQLVLLFNSSNTRLVSVPSATGASSTVEATSGTVCASSDQLIVQANGTTYTVLRNGSSMGLSWTDSGGVLSIGSAYRYGGLVVQRNSFVNSCSLSNWTMADLGVLDVPAPTQAVNRLTTY